MLVGSIRRNLGWIILIVLVGVLIAAAAYSPRHPNEDISANTTHGGQPSVDWERPIIGGTEVADLAHATAQLTFVASAPRVASAIVRILVGNDSIAWVYQDSVIGRFVLIESHSVWTQQQVEALATCDPADGCEGTWALVKIRGGISALFISGRQSTGVIWLENGVTYDLFGPPGSFTRPVSISVADSV